MSADALHYLDATELVGLIRSRQVSPVEVMRADLDRIAAVGDRVNAIVTLLGEQAMSAAVAAERAVAPGDDLGPLHGVPFTVKDSLDTAGIATQRGSRLFAGRVPGRDATSVARMKAAGAIVLAKTNLPEFSYWTETDNLLTGRSLNPWDPGRTPGGSSGGEAAAIASGMSPLGLGSDVAISVRGPAHDTGIVALKATRGRIPLTGTGRRCRAASGTSGRWRAASATSGARCQCWPGRTGPTGTWWPLPHPRRRPWAVAGRLADGAQVPSRPATRNRGAASRPDITPGPIEPETGLHKVRALFSYVAAEIIGQAHRGPGQPA